MTGPGGVQGPGAFAEHERETGRWTAASNRADGMLAAAVLQAPRYFPPEDIDAKQPGALQHVAVGGVHLSESAFPRAAQVNGIFRAEKDAPRKIAHPRGATSSEVTGSAERGSSRRLRSRRTHRAPLPV